jgi:hypothetical protein
MQEINLLPKIQKSNAIGRAIDDGHLHELMNRPEFVSEIGRWTGPLQNHAINQAFKEKNPSILASILKSNRGNEAIDKALDGAFQQVFSSRNPQDLDILLQASKGIKVSDVHFLKYSKMAIDNRNNQLFEIFMKNIKIFDGQTVRTMIGSKWYRLSGDMFQAKILESLILHADLGKNREASRLAFSHLKEKLGKIGTMSILGKNMQTGLFRYALRWEDKAIFSAIIRDNSMDLPKMISLLAREGKWPLLLELSYMKTNKFQHLVGSEIHLRVPNGELKDKLMKVFPNIVKESNAS